MSKSRSKSRKKSKKKQPPYITTFKQKLYGTKYKPNNKVNSIIYKPQDIFTEMKFSHSFNQILNISKLLSSPQNPYHRFMFGSSYAKSYQEIRSDNYFPYTNNIEKDLNWMSVGIIRDASIISKFIEEARSFNNQFLLGNYEEAGELLEKIIHDFGLSHWAVEKKFLLNEYGEGLESNKKFLSKIVGNKNNHILFLYISEFLSLKSEAKLSFDNFNQRFNKALTDDLGNNEELIAYLKYRLGVINTDLVKDAPSILYFDSPTSIIDRYFTFINILQACALFGNESKDVAFQIIKRIEGKISDYRIDSLLQYFIPEKPLCAGALSKKILQILDDYTTGNYEKCIKSSKDLLVENPDNYELYYIYIRSLDYCQKKFKQIFSEGSVAAKLLNHTSTIIKGEENWQRSCDFLLKMSISFWRDPLAYKLFDFYLREAFPVRNRSVQKLALLNTSIFNPKFATIYDDADKSKTFISQFPQANNHSILSLIKRITTSSNKEDAELILPETISQSRRRIYNALIYLRTNQPEEAIELFEPLFTDLIEKKIAGGFYTREKILRGLYEAYNKIGALSKCTNLIVSNYLWNKLSIKKIPIVDIIKKIDTELPENVMGSITYPILYRIYYSKARAIYVAYDNFLSSIGINKPTQLIKTQNRFEKNELIFFLSEVCTTDVLACSYHFNGTEELETERVKICQYLSKNDSKNLKKYSDEISSITSKSIIRKGIRQIDYSKIYVDELGVRTSGRKILQESFERYREMASMSSIDTLKMLNPSTLQLFTRTEEGELIKKNVSLDDIEKNVIFGTRIVHNSLFRIFKELFVDIRDRFISSGEYGLDGYLSVRIRHGVFQNQIRSSFEELHLISEKDTTTGEYLPNPYWKQRLDYLPKSTNTKIQNILSIFSQQVDEVATRINQQFIQVRTEKKNEAGLFDYTFSELELFTLFEEEFVKITDFDRFIDSVFRILWRRTQKNIEHIQIFIMVEVRNKINSFIKNLEQSVRQVTNSSQLAELLQNITICRTKSETSLLRISDWFTISRTSLVPEFSFKNLVNICIESINNIYPNKRVQPKINISTDLTIDGKFFPPFFDIIRTLLDNTLIHSGLSPNQIEIEIEIQIQMSHLEIRIKNCLSEEMLETDPAEKLNKFHTSIETSKIPNAIATEGNSGLLKVRKIMDVDLQRKNSSIDFNYDKENKFVVKINMESKGLNI